MAFRIQVAKRRQTDRGAVLRQRLRQILRLGQHRHRVCRQGQRLDAARRAGAVGIHEHAVAAGALRIGVVDVRGDRGDGSRRSPDRRKRAVAFRAARDLVQLGLHEHVARHRDAAHAEEIGVLRSRQVGLHPVEGGLVLADEELVIAHLCNRISGGVHRDAHIARHRQVTIASEAGVAGHGGLRVRVIGADADHAGAQSAGRSGLRKAVNRIGGIHLHGAGAACARADLERRGERAGCIRLSPERADVDIGDAAVGDIDARIGIGVRSGQHIDAAGDLQHGAAHHGGGRCRDGRARLADFAADERHIRAAAGADLRGRRVIVGRAANAVGVEFRLDRDAARLDRRALDHRLLIARNLRGDDVDRNLHHTGREVLALNVRRRLGVARHGDVDRAAGDVDDTASVDAGGRRHVRFGIGHVVHGVDAAQAGAAAGLRGNRVRAGRVCVEDGHARSIHAARNLRTKVALRIGVQGVDADADGAGGKVVAVDQRIRKGESGSLDEERARDFQRGFLDLGMIGGIRRCDRHVRLRVDAGERSAALAVLIALSAVGAQNGVRAPALVRIQLRGDRNASRVLDLQRERFDICLLARVQRRSHGIGRHIDEAAGHAGLLHRRFRARNAGRLDEHRSGGHRARAADVRIDPGRVLRDRHVHLDIVLRDVHAAGGRRQIRLRQAGGVRLHGHRADIGLPDAGSVIRHDQERVKAALSVGIRRAQRCADLADAAQIRDLGERIGVALGQNADAARRVDGIRTQARIGLGARVGHGNIDAHVDQRAAAGMQLRLRALRIGIMIVEVGIRCDAARIHMAAGQRRFLTGAQHRRGKRRIHAGRADVHAGDLGMGEHRAIGRDREAGLGNQLAVAHDIGEIPCVVIRDGGVHAHGDQARRARDRIRRRFGPVARSRLARAHADHRRVDLDARGVNQGLIAGAQMHIAHGEADVRRADRRREQLRFGDGLILGQNGDRSVSMHVRTDDSGDGIRFVEDQKRVAVHRRTAAHHRQDGRNGRAVGVVFHRDGIRRHAALALGGRAGSRIAAVGRRADVGQDLRSNQRHRCGHIDRRATEGYAENIRLGMGFYVRRDVNATVRMERDALSDERIHAAAVDHQRHRAVRAYAARRKGAGAAHGIGVQVRLNLRAVRDRQVCVARNGGLHRAVKHGCGHGSANARKAARRRQRRGQHERIIHDGLDKQVLRLRDIAFHTGDDVGMDIDRADRRGDAHNGAGARDGNRADGAGRQVDGVVALERILQRSDAVVVLIAHRRGARARGNLDLTRRGQHGVVLHLRQDVGVQHRNRDARAHAGIHTGGDGTGDHIRNQVVTGDHLDIARRGHRGRAADIRADAVLRIIGRSRCAEISRSRDIAVLRLVDHEVVAAGILARIARIVKLRAAIPVLGLEGMLRFAVAVRLRAAHGDFGLTDAVALEQSAQVVLAVCLRGAVTGCESTAHEGVRLEAAADLLIVGFLLLVGERFILLPRERIALAEQRVARILRELAAGHGHHDRGADANLSRRDRARVGIDVALRNGVHRDRILPAFDHVARAEARGDRVVDHVDDGRDAHADHAAGRQGGRDRVGGQHVLGAYGDGIRLDGRAVARHGLRGLLEHAHVHRAGYAGSAADGNARGVSREELRGIGRHAEALLRIDVRAVSDERAGRSFIIGNDAHGRNARRAAAGSRGGDVEQIVVRFGLDRGVSGRANHAAHARQNVALEHQRARANRDARRAAARKVQRQQQHFVVGNRGNRDVASRAHERHRVNDGLAGRGFAPAENRLDRLVIDHDDGGSAHAGRAAHSSAADSVD